MSTALTVSLILLVFVIMGAIIATTVYFVKLLIELTLLTKNLDETTTIVKGELEPILGELKETMTNVNNLAKMRTIKLQLSERFLQQLLVSLLCLQGNSSFCRAVSLKVLFLHSTFSEENNKHL